MYYSISNLNNFLLGIKRLKTLVKLDTTFKQCDKIFLYQKNTVSQTTGHQINITGPSVIIEATSIGPLVPPRLVAPMV